MVHFFKAYMVDSIFVAHISIEMFYASYEYIAYFILCKISY